jgi:hypothetical protein
MHNLRNCFFLFRATTLATLCLLSLSIQQPLYANSQCGLKQLQSGDQIALVIANSYDGTLRHSVNDGNAMQKVLEKLNFKVIFKTELNGDDMDRATLDFAECLKISQEVGLFYFTGYGMQLDNKNYLLPIDANLSDKLDVPYKTFSVDQMFKRLTEVNNEYNIIILDASRDNPYLRLDPPGLAKYQEVPSDFFIAYSTGANQVVSEAAENENSLYARKLVEILEVVQEHTPVEDVFKQVSSAVEEESSGRQIPSRLESTSQKKFCFGGCKESEHVNVKLDMKLNVEGARIFFDKTDLGILENITGSKTVPLVPIKKHTAVVRIEKDGYYPYETKIDVQPAKEIKGVRLEPLPKLMPSVGF